METTLKELRRLQLRLVRAAGCLDGALAANQSVTVVTRPLPHYFPVKLLFFDDDLVAELAELEGLLRPALDAGPSPLAIPLRGALAAALAAARELGERRWILEDRDRVSGFLSLLDAVLAPLAAWIDMLLAPPPVQTR